MINVGCKAKLSNLIDVNLGALVRRGVLLEEAALALIHYHRATRIIQLVSMLGILLEDDSKRFLREKCAFHGIGNEVVAVSGKYDNVCTGECAEMT